MPLEAPTFLSAAVAAPHRLAAEAGRDALIDGANAIEAAVAMAACLAVLCPHVASLGSDAVWLIGEPGRGGGVGPVRSLVAGGRAARLATASWFRDKGFEAIPTRGPDAILTSPAVTEGWQQALELSRTLGGVVPFGRLLEPAIRHARDGVAVSRSEADHLPGSEDELWSTPGFGELFRPEGNLLSAGALRRQPRLADTLEQLAHAGLGDLTRGDVAREIAADLERFGSPLRRDDLRRTEGRWRPALSIELGGGCMVHDAPPPAGGVGALALLGLVERLTRSRSGSFEQVHGLIEAAKRAVLIENWVNEGTGGRDRLAAALDHQVLSRQASLVSMGEAAVLPVAASQGGSVWLGAIDATGLAVSVTQSIGSRYGSGCVLPRTGILMGNRGAAFSLDPVASDVVRPGLVAPGLPGAALAVFRDGRVLTLGASGLEGQPWLSAEILSRVRQGEGLADALAAPRFRSRSGSEGTPLIVEAEFDPGLVRRLERAGHAIETVSDEVVAGFGEAGALVRRVGGLIEAVHDEKADGSVAGL